MNDKMFILWEGTISVRVQRTNPKTRYEDEYWLENLNKGSCVAVYSCFDDRLSSLVNYYAGTSFCTILSIEAKDLEQLAESEGIIAL